MVKKETPRLEGSKELFDDMKEAFLNGTPLKIKDVDFNLVSWLIEQTEKAADFEERNNDLIDRQRRWKQAFKEIKAICDRYTEKGWALNPDKIEKIIDEARVK